MSRAIADKAKTIRTPVHMSDLIGRVTRAKRSFVQEFGREPTPQELADELGVTTVQIATAERCGLTPISFDAPISGEAGAATYGDFVEDREAVSPLEAAITTRLAEQVRTLLATLPPRERSILEMRFGMRAGGEQTLEQVGRTFGVTRERIRQIEAHALRRLQHPARARERAALGD